MITGSTRVYHALLRSCLRLNKVAICRFIPRQTSGPALVALLPQETVTIGPQNSATVFPEGFYAIQLPYADDQREPPMPMQTALPEEVRPYSASHSLAKAKMAIVPLRSSTDGTAPQYSAHCPFRNKTKPSKRC